MGHGQFARVEEPLGAVGHAALLGFVELTTLDVARDALGKAGVCEGVYGALDSRLLGFVVEDRAQLALVLLVEPREVGFADGSVVHIA